MTNHLIWAAGLFGHLVLLAWAIMLVFLLRPLRLSWRSHVVSISLGLGIYSASLLAGGGNFTIGREMRDYVFFSDSNLACKRKNRIVR
jgi:hypothetical protein